MWIKHLIYTSTFIFLAFLFIFTFYEYFKISLDSLIDFQVKVSYRYIPRTIIPATGSCRRTPEIAVDTSNKWLDIAQFDFVYRILRMFIKIENIEIYML
jgi:hypothetical protein